MGTNYYFINDTTKERLHIGKSSSGNPFIFHALPQYKLMSVTDWMLFISYEQGKIYDEYHKEIPIGTFATITNNHKNKYIEDESCYSYTDYLGYRFLLGEFC